jgi:predicted dehydrogenase
LPDDIHVALIGAGRHGRDLLNYCLDIPGVRFKAVCDIWPYAQKYASGILRKRGQPVSVYEDYREMLAREKGLDAAIIATPDSFHAAQTIACLKAKLHVYCEKEMVTTIEDAREVVCTAKQACRLLQVGRQHRSNPRYHTALEYIYEKKTIGRITSVFGQWHGHKRVPYKWPEKETIPAETLRRYGYASMDEHRNWRWLAKFSAGELVNLGAHQIDVFNWFLRAVPKGVIASGGLDYYDFYELHDIAQCVFEWDFTWEGTTKTVRGVHRTLTTTDAGGFWEMFQGPTGVFAISEDPRKGGFWFQQCSDGAVLKDDLPLFAVGYSMYADVLAGEEFGLLMQLPPNGFLPGARVKMYVPEPWISGGHIGRKYEPQFWGPVLAPQDDKPPHWYHLKNFFDAMRGTAKLTCPAEVGFQGAVSALKAVEAMKAGRRLELKPEEFQVP